MNAKRVLRPAGRPATEALPGTPSRRDAASSRPFAPALITRFAQETPFPSDSAWHRRGAPAFRLSGDHEPGYSPERGHHFDGSGPRHAAVGGILIVEDDGDLRETLADILQYEGYRVETAANGQEGWARLALEPVPALILLDLMMPVMNGWDFRVRQLRDPLRAGIPVVVISAAESVDEQAALLSANGYLVKPIDVSILIETVSRFVG